MCYMESKMQEQIEHGLARMEELERQYDYFCEWYLSTFVDGDETLISKTHLDERFYLNSPVQEVNAMWLGWRSAKSL